MFKHVILWQLKDELTPELKETVKREAKAALEGLVGQVPGLLSGQVNINGIDTSNADMMLDCTLQDEASLRAYATHPAHVAVADSKVRPFTKARVCMDFPV